MMAASISAMALAAPELIVSPTQAFPSACSDAVTSGTPNNNNGSFNDGETVTCVSPSGISEIRSDADDVTIVIGDTSTPAIVTSGGSGDFGVRLGDGGRIDIRNPMSSISGREAAISLNTTIGSPHDLTVVSQGLISSFDGYGIIADHDGDGSIFIEVDDVDGQLDGIRANVMYNTAGGVNINSSGFVRGQTGVGILIDTDGTGDVTIDAAAAITGAQYGVQIDKSGSGAVDVQATSITGSVYDAVRIVNSTGTDVRVTTSGAVYGARSGIIIGNGGNNGTTVAAGDVTGATNVGIFVQNGAGGVSVTSTGTVTSGGYGIFVENNGAGGVTVDANNVTSNSDAIVARSASGDVRISSTGSVSATTTIGILAFSAGAGEMEVDVVDVSGGIYGIYAINGSGATNITVAGAVTGQTSYGIGALTADGVQLTVAEGGSVVGAVTAIDFNGPGNDIVTLEPGSTVTGDIRLGDGDDTFNDGSGQFASFFGGDGTDTVTFMGGEARVIDGSGNSGDRFQGVEIFNIDMDGIELTGEHTGLSEVNFNAGTNRLSGTLTSTQIMVAEGATLNAGDGSRITGFLDIQGTLAIGNSPGTTFVDGDVVFGPNSVLPIEIQGDAHDLLVATGAVALDGDLEIIVLGGVEPGLAERTIIESGTGVTGSFATISEQAVGSGQTGLLISHEVAIDDSALNVLLTTTVTSPSSIDGLNENQSNVGANLIDLLAQPSLDRDLAVFINTVGGISDAGDLAATLSELHPEGFDGGLRFLANSQNRFMSGIMNGDGQVPVERSKNEEGAYFWTSVGVSGLSQGSDYEHVGFDGDAYEFSAGVSEIGQGRVRLGFAGGYATFSGETEKGIADDIDASLYRFAASARMEMDGPGVNGKLAGVASFAKANNKLTMNLIDPVNDASNSQSGKADVRTAGLAAQYTVTGINGKVWPVQPHVRIGLDAVSQDEVTIGTSQGTALMVDEVESTRAHAALGASVEHRIDAALSISASATGVQYWGDTENVFQSRFAVAPEGAPGFETVGAGVKRKAEVRAGFVYEHESGFNLMADASGEVGDVTAYTARIELSREF